MKTFLFVLFTCIYVYTEGQMATNKWITFENTKYSYKFSYPSNWKIKGTPEEYAINDISNDGKGTEPEIFFSVYENENDSSLEYIQKLEKKSLNVIKGRPNFQLIATRTQYRSGKPGLITDFIYTKTNKDKERLHSIIWLINKGNHVFRLMYIGKNELNIKYIGMADEIYNSFSFLNEPPRLSKSYLNGRWEGTIAESLPNASNIKQYPFTIIFKGYNDSTKTIETVQIVDNFIKHTIDTLYVSTPAEIFDKGLSLPYNRELPDKKQCNIELNLSYNIKDGIQYLISDNTAGEPVCFRVSISLKKVSDETDLMISKQNPLVYKAPQPTKDNNRDEPHLVSSEEEMLHAGARLFDTIRILPASSDVVKGATVKMNLSDKEKLSILKHSGLKLSSDGRKFIDNATTEPFDAELNAFDFDNDGTYELILWKHDGSGPQGASAFTIYYNKHGVSFFKPILMESGYPKVRKEKIDNFPSILIIGPGMKLPLYRWKGLSYKFVGLVADEEEAINESILVGGSTPEELGRQLLKALQKNDFKLWQHCLHPIETRFRDVCEFRFKQHRDRLEGAGISDWNLIKFSRVTYTKEDAFGSDGGKARGEEIRRNFIIEFTYKNNEFLGALGSMTIMTYKKEKYFVFSQSEGAGIMRYKKNN